MEEALLSPLLETTKGGNPWQRQESSLLSTRRKGGGGQHWQHKAGDKTSRLLLGFQALDRSSAPRSEGLSAHGEGVSRPVGRLMQSQDTDVYKMVLPPKLPQSGHRPGGPEPSL